MCEPTTIMMATMAVIAAVAAAQQAASASAQAKHQQRVANQNARLTTEQMRDAQERGSDTEQQVMLDGARTLSDTRSALAANNMDLTFGSPLDTILETSVEIDRDAFRVRRNTAAEVNDLAIRRNSFRNGSNAAEAAGANARVAGVIGVTGAVVGGASSTFGAASNAGLVGGGSSATPFAGNSARPSTANIS